jgi:O-acetyl-ADP-ribose deacetylase (regulator of RNase III)
LPALGTGVGHVPPAISAEAMLSAIIAHVKPGTSSLRKIVIVVYEDGVLKTFSETLKRLGGGQ